MGVIPPTTAVHLAKKAAHDALTIVFPACRQGLEIETGDGHRVFIYRKRSQNIWGIDSVDRSDEWEKNMVENYCSHMNPLDIRYGEDSFDCVVWNGTMPDYTDMQLDTVMGHLKRVSSERLILTAQQTRGRNINEWLKIFKRHAIFPECIHRDGKNELVVEARTVLWRM